MQKSFQTLLQNLHYCPSFHSENHFKNWITEEEVGKLKDLALIEQGSDLTEIPCESCEELHFTQVWAEKGQIFTLCPRCDHSPRQLDEVEVQRWGFKVDAFLQQMAFQLDMKDQVEALVVAGLWQVGTFTRDDTHHTCYFFCGQSFEEVVAFIKKQPVDLRRYIVITCRQESTQELKQALLLIQAEHLADLKGGAVQFSKNALEDHLTAGFRSVYFDERNGDLLVNGKPLVNITPSTPEFHFAQALWSNFNMPQSHNKLVTYIFEKTGLEYADTAAKTCHKMRANIKKEAKDKKIFDQIIRSTKDLDGNNSYTMKSPA